MLCGINRWFWARIKIMRWDKMLGTREKVQCCMDDTSFRHKSNVHVAGVSVGTGTKKRRLRLGVWVKSSVNMSGNLIIWGLWCSGDKKGTRSASARVASARRNASGLIAWRIWLALVQRERSPANQYKCVSDHLCPTMTHCYPDRERSDFIKTMLPSVGHDGRVTDLTGIVRSQTKINTRGRIWTDALDRRRQNSQRGEYLSEERRPSFQTRVA